jgi:hypothetical protein
MADICPQYNIGISFYSFDPIVLEQCFIYDVSSVNVYEVYKSYHSLAQNKKTCDYSPLLTAFSLSKQTKTSIA